MEQNVSGNIISILFLIILFIGLILYGLKNKHVEISEIENPQKKETETLKAEGQDKQIIGSEIGPNTLDDFVGNENVKERIRTQLIYCKQRNKAFPHTIFYGYGGLGKSSLAKIIAREMGGNYYEVTPAIVNTYASLMNLFFNKKCLTCYAEVGFTELKCPNCKVPKMGFSISILLKENDLIFIDEIHSLDEDVEEYLYSAMQDFYISVKEQGKFVTKKLPQFTLCGATTKLGDINNPLKQRFKLKVRLRPYSIEDITKILVQASSNMGLDIQSKTIDDLAKRSFGIPRIATGFLSELKAINNSEIIMHDSLEKLYKFRENMDELGLSDTHKDILNYIKNRTENTSKGVGARAIAIACGLNEKEYVEVYEQELIYQQLITQTSTGRILTDKAKNLYFKGAGKP